MAKLALNGTKLAWLVAVLVLLVAPICYALGGWAALAWGTAFGLLNGLPRRANFVTGAALGLIAGSTLSPDFSLTAGAGFAFLATLLTGLAPTLAAESEVDPPRLLLAALIGLLVGGSMGAAFMYVRG